MFIDFFIYKTLTAKGYCDILEGVTEGLTLHRHVTCGSCDSVDDNLDNFLQEINHGLLSLTVL